MPPYAQKDVERFWSYVIKGEPLECWWWMGSSVEKDDARGLFGVDGRTVLAHRFALADSLGRDISPGLCCRHKCDNTLCMNPKHLEEGTHADNMRDKVRRGRCPKTNKQKLSLQKAKEIRTKYKNGTKVEMLAKEYGTINATIYHVLQGRTWVS